MKRPPRRTLAAPSTPSWAMLRHQRDAAKLGHGSMSSMDEWSTPWIGTPGFPGRPWSCPTLREPADDAYRGEEDIALSRSSSGNYTT
jgi:hypothetical protein